MGPILLAGVGCRVNCQGERHISANQNWQERLVLPGGGGGRDTDSCLGSFHLTSFNNFYFRSQATVKSKMHRLTYSHIGIYIRFMARAATTSDAFNAVAEPRRRQILEYLAGGERAVGDVVIRLGMEQPSVSKHLSVLRQVGLVRVRRHGRQMLYQANGDGIRPLYEWTRDLRASVVTSVAADQGTGGAESEGNRETLRQDIRSTVRRQPQTAVVNRIQRRKHEHQSNNPGN